MSTIGAVIVSVVVFYGWFGDTYRAMLSRPAASAAAPGGDATPVMRREAHQMQFVPGLPALGARVPAIPRYVERYYGFWLIARALVGFLAGRGRPRDPLGALAAGWILASAFFFVLGHVSSLDIRYYLGAYPALAIVSAQAQSGRWTTRTAGALLLSYGAVSAVMYWLAWLGAWP